MNENLDFQFPVIEIEDSIQIVDFVGRDDSPLVLKSKFMQIVAFGTREESFGHEIVRFQLFEASEKRPQESKDSLFFGYSSPGLVFTDGGHYLFFVSPVGGAGKFDPSEHQFAIMYPLVAIDLVKRRFAFVKDNLQAPFSTESIPQSLNEKNFEWHSGFSPQLVVAKFRELNPRIDSISEKTLPAESSFLRKALRLFRLLD